MPELSLLTIFCYSFMAISQWGYVFCQWRKPKAFFYGASIVALLGHTLLLYWGIETDLGQNLPWFNMLSLLTWLMGGFVVSMAPRQPVHNLVIILYPLSALSVLMPLILPGGDVIVRTIEQPGVLAHIVISLVAASILGLAALQAGLVALQHRRLNRSTPLWQVLPPLETMEILLFRLLWCGFILLTASLITGFVFLDDLFAQHLYPKTLLSFFAWVLLSYLLWGRHVYGWRGLTAVRGTLSGVCLLWLAYFGSKIWIT